MTTVQMALAAHLSGLEAVRLAERTAYFAKKHLKDAASPENLAAAARTLGLQHMGAAEVEQILAQLRKATADYMLGVPLHPPAKAPHES